MSRIERRQRIALPIDQAFAFYGDARNLERITPPWLGFEVTTPAPIAMGVGTLIEYRLKLHRVPVRWRTRIEAWEPPRRFVDVQARGPYALWEHAHEFEEDGSGDGDPRPGAVLDPLRPGRGGGRASAGTSRPEADLRLPAGSGRARAGRARPG